LQKRENYRKDRFMFVKSEYKLQRVNLDDILFIEGLKDYVRIYLKNGDRLMSLMSMKKIDDYLPRPEFLRTHRSYIVHMSEVKTIDRFRIVFGDTFIPISDNYKDDVQRYLEGHTLA
jgi:DNA-binding LytR/AlgR family response regulator